LNFPTNYLQTVNIEQDAMNLRIKDDKDNAS